MPRKEGRKEGSKEARKQGSKAARKQGSKEARSKQARKGGRSNVSVPGCSLYFVFCGGGAAPSPLF